MFSGILARPFVIERKYEFEALTDVLLKFFTSSCPFLHLLQLFFGYQLAGLFMPRQAALLVFFAGAAGARGISICFGRAEGVGQNGLTPGSLVGTQHFLELFFADTVLKANLVGIASLDQLVYRLQGI